MARNAKNHVISLYNGMVLKAVERIGIPMKHGSLSTFNKNTAILTTARMEYIQNVHPKRIFLVAIDGPFPYSKSRFM